jgi:hypothetical protein
MELKSSSEYTSNDGKSLHRFDLPTDATAAISQHPPTFKIVGKFKLKREKKKFHLKTHKLFPSFLQWNFSNSIEIENGKFYYVVCHTNSLSLSSYCLLFLFLCQQFIFFLSSTLVSAEINKKAQDNCVYQTHIRNIYSIFSFNRGWGWIWVDK